MRFDKLLCVGGSAFLTTVLSYLFAEMMASNSIVSFGLSFVLPGEQDTLCAE